MNSYYILSHNFNPNSTKLLQTVFSECKYSNLTQNIGSKAHDDWMQIQQNGTKIIQNTLQIDYNSQLFCWLTLISFNITLIFE